MKIYNNDKSPRRNFIKQSAILTTATAFLPSFTSGCKEKAQETAEKAVTVAQSSTKDLFFKLSLAQWSFHKALFGKKMDNLSFIDKASELGFDGVEYVNQFFKDKAEDISFLDQLNAKAKEHDLVQNLIMIDGEGGLGLTDDIKRTEAINKHHKWVHAAKYLGCGSIRVNAYGEGSAEEVSTAAIDGLGRLSEYAAKENINVIVENHGGVLIQWRVDG